jgi:hypothetical protein
MLEPWHADWVNTDSPTLLPALVNMNLMQVEQAEVTNRGSIRISLEDSMVLTIEGVPGPKTSGAPWWISELKS